MEQQFVAFNVDGMNNVDRMVEDLLCNTLSYMNEKAKTTPATISKLNPNEVEKLSYNSLVEVAPSVNFPKDRIDLVSGHVFPDILLHDTSYGVEIKSTKDDKWTSIGSSVVESTRNADTERVYMLFAKLGGLPTFRCKPYQQCLSKIAVTHSPRYLIDMNLNEDNNIFALMNTDYDDFRTLDETEKINYIRNYYIEKAKTQGKHEMPWWMGKASNVNLSFFADQPIEEKNILKAKALILFDSVFNDINDRSKYKDLSLWLCTHHSLLCTNMRDIFTAGGNIKYIDGKQLVKPYPHIVGEVLRFLPLIKDILNKPDEDILDSIKERWSFKFDNSNLFESWLDMIDYKFKSQKSLKDIPIRNLIERNAVPK